MLYNVLLNGESWLIARYLLTWVPMVILAIALHEAGHAYSALWLGDRTAQLNGRCTLNPLAHFDPLGFLMVLFGPIGWGKPVPFNPLAFRNQERDTMLVAAAGPAVNVVLAVVFAVASALIWKLAPDAFYVRTLDGRVQMETSDLALTMRMLYCLFIGGVALNLGLAFFNLIPLFPLDGEKILGWFLPRAGKRYLESIRPQAPMILLVLISLGWIFHLPVLWWVISIASYPVSVLLTGHSLAHNYGLFYFYLENA